MLARRVEGLKQAIAAAEERPATDGRVVAVLRQSLVAAQHTHAAVKKEQLRRIAAAFHQGLERDIKVDLHFDVGGKRKPRPNE